MDTSVLLTNVIRLYNEAIAAGLKANETEVLAQLAKIRDLLNENIAKTEPAEPE